jgi:hypothetical protein
MKEESAAFLKKSSKKLLLLGCRAVSPAGSKYSKVFCGTGVGVPPFFQKSDRFLS